MFVIACNLRALSKHKPGNTASSVWVVCLPRHGMQRLVSLRKTGLFRAVRFAGSQPFYGIACWT